MTRFEQRREDYFNALERLKEAVKQGDSDIIIDGILHRFEFTFELAWKTMKDCLEDQGIVGKIGSPREIIKEAFAAGLIENGEIWMDMMISRNELSHLYDEETSREIYEYIVSEYIDLFENLKKKLNEEII